MSIVHARQKGFTIIEMTIVVIVIGILATIIYASYANVQERGRQARLKAEAYTVKEAIETARNRAQKSLADITGTLWTGQYCQFQPPGAPNPGAAIPNGTDFSVQNTMTQRCWDDYSSAMQKISDASGIDVTGFKDPWGRPYYIDENEQSVGTYECSSDVITWLAYPYKGGNTQDWSLQIFIPAYKSKCYS